MPGLDFDPYSDEVLTGPYEHYRLLRETGPLVWLQKYGVYASGRYETVMRVLTDPQVFCSSPGVGLTNFHTEKPWRKPSIILEVDPREYSQTRKVFIRILPPPRPSTSCASALKVMRTAKQCAPHCPGMRRPRHGVTFA